MRDVIGTIDITVLYCTCVLVVMKRKTWINANIEEFKQATSGNSFPEKESHSVIKYVGKMNVLQPTVERETKFELTSPWLLISRAIHKTLRTHDDRDGRARTGP